MAACDSQQSMPVANDRLCIVVRRSTGKVLHKSRLTRVQEAIRRLTMQYMAQLWWYILWVRSGTAVDDRISCGLQRAIILGGEIFLHCDVSAGRLVTECGFLAIRPESEFWMIGMILCEFTNRLDLPLNDGIALLIPEDVSSGVGLFYIAALHLQPLRGRKTVSKSVCRKPFSNLLDYTSFPNANDKTIKITRVPGNLSI
jgi:hypothetical protein